MDIRVLGPFGVYDDQGRKVELGGRQQRIVLAVLLLHRNEIVSVDRLIDAVWDERVPANAVKNVQIYVSRLRKALEPDSQNARPESGTGVLRRQAGGYVLEVGPDELDADRFGRLVEEGRRALAAGSAEVAATALAEALALWRGPPSPTSPTTRSRRARSAGWRSCDSAQSRSGSRRIWLSAATPKSLRNCRLWLPSIHCENAFAGSGARALSLRPEA